MKVTFHGRKITGLLSVIPNNIIKYEDEIHNYIFPAKQSLRLQKVMGFKQHAIAREDCATSDLCLYGLEYILGKGWLKKDDIGAVVVGRTLPDYFTPTVSNIIQGKLGLSEEVYCLDLSQGCNAFLTVLTEGFAILERLGGKKVVAIAADVLSKKASKKDRNIYPLTGDAAGIAILENAGDDDIYTIARSNGAMGDAIIIPAGGSRLPSSDKTRELKDFNNDGNLRSLDNVAMKGIDIFSFAQTKVPPLVEETLAYAGVTKEDIEYFLFHQPNKFMVKKLADKLGLPYDKVPMNVVEEFGNSSGACIPVCAAYNLAETLKKERHLYCLAAFGAGLTWQAMVMNLGSLDFCEVRMMD